MLLMFSALIIFSGCSGDDNLAGTTDETVTGNQIAATVHKPDGSPAGNASVKVFLRSSTTLAFDTVADDSGQYSVSGLDGTYSMLFTKDNFVAYQDSVYINPDSGYIGSDTLKKESSLSAIVGLQQGALLQTVEVKVLGTDLFSNVDAQGKFTLTGLPEGRYQLRLTSTLPDYTPTYEFVTVKSGTNITLQDTLTLLYTGIPTVKGIVATYDYVTGTVFLSWDKTNYENFQKYLVLKQETSIAVIDTIPITAITDTFFTDNIYPVRSLDTNSYTFEYRIKIRDKSNKEGPVYGYVESKVTPTITQMNFGRLPSLTDSVNHNDTVRIAIEGENKTRFLQSLSWAAGSPDSLVKTLDLDSSKTNFSDTLSIVWPEEGDFFVYVKCSDYSGLTWADSFKVVVINDFLNLNAGNDTVVLSGSSVKLSPIAEYQESKIAKWEWDIGNTGTFVSVDSGDTTITMPPGEQSGFICICKVTNENNWVALDTVIIQSKSLVILTPAKGVSISGIVKVSGLADSSILELQVKIAENDWIKTTGVVQWSADVDTRLLFPLDSTTLSIKIIREGVSDEIQEFQVILNNADPVIGRWTANYPDLPSHGFEFKPTGEVTGVQWGCNDRHEWRRTSDSTLVFNDNDPADCGTNIKVTWVNADSLSLDIPTLDTSSPVSCSRQ
ncbi:MAG: carboxypeptidase regulatory-like domain-containing protein [Fibrobacteria bacterium]|nr:carboxypeptidase regulatory-like domain-containing protein [Fibrobacteria bacterium]